MLRFTLAAFTLFAVAVPAQAAVRKVPQQFATIQSAIDNAAPGDTIKISKGEYRENVSADVANLQIKGEDGVIIDARPNGVAGDGPAIKFLASGITLSDVLVRHAAQVTPLGGPTFGFNLWIDAADCTLRRVTSLHAGTGHLATTSSASGLEIDDCTFEGPGTLYLTAASTRVTKCKLRRCDGISAQGADVEVTSCSFEGTVNGVAAFESSALISKNSFHALRSSPLFMIGEGAVVRSNTFDACPSSSIQSDDALVEKNTFTNAISNAGGAAAIDVVECSGATISDNEFSDCGTVAIRFGHNAAGAIASGNSIKRCGDTALIPALGGSDPHDAAIDVATNSATVSGNTIKECAGDGIHVDGINNHVVNNVVKSCHEDGIDVEGSMNVVTGNEAKKNHAEGIENNGTDTTMNDNVASKNRIDIANDGTFSSFTGNTPAGTPPAPEIDDEGTT